MDFTKINCISESCKGKGIIMNGDGGCFGGRVSYAGLKCPECGVRIIIMPISEKYEYTFTATTEKERIEDRINKAKEESELALAKTINRIKETGF